VDKPVPGVRAAGAELRAPRAGRRHLIAASTPRLERYARYTTTIPPCPISARSWQGSRYFLPSFVGTLPSRGSSPTDRSRRSFASCSASCFACSRSRVTACHRVWRDIARATSKIFTACRRSRHMPTSLCTLSRFSLDSCCVKGGLQDSYTYFSGCTDEGELQFRRRRRSNNDIPRLQQPHYQNTRLAGVKMSLR
jgi:hypothetical protein